MPKTIAKIVNPLRTSGLAPLLGSGKSVFHIEAGNTANAIEIYSYVCRIENVLYAPGSPALLRDDLGLAFFPDCIAREISAHSTMFGTLSAVTTEGRSEFTYEAPSLTIEEPVVCLYFTGNPGLFVQDVVVSAFRVKKFVKEGYRFLIPDTLSDRNKEFLELAGVTARDHLPVPADKVIRVKTAIVPSRPGARHVMFTIGGQERQLRYLLEPDDTALFNRQVQSRFGGRPLRRLYISRRDATVRHVVNDAEVSRMLETRFGFETLALSDLSVAELVSAFANAEIVVALHGAALFNIALCPLGTKVIEIDHPRNAFHAFGISRALRHHYAAVGRIPEAQRAAPAEQNNVDITVDLGELETTVDSMLRKPSTPREFVVSRPG